MIDIEELIGIAKAAGKDVNATYLAKLPVGNYIKIGREAYTKVNSDNQFIEEDIDCDECAYVILIGDYYNRPTIGLGLVGKAETMYDAISTHNQILKRIQDSGSYPDHLVGSIVSLDTFQCITFFDTDKNMWT